MGKARPPRGGLGHAARGKSFKSRCPESDSGGVLAVLTTTTVTVVVRRIIRFSCNVKLVSTICRRALCILHCILFYYTVILHIVGNYDISNSGGG